MSPDRDPGRFDDDGREPMDYEEDAPRSIFSALWFRAVLVMLVLGVVAAVAVPYVLDFATTPAPVKPGAAKSAAPAPTAPPGPVAKAVPAPPPPAPVATAAPAVVPAPPAAEPARPKSEPPAPAAAKPAPAKPAPKPVAARAEAKPAVAKAEARPAARPEPAKVPAVVARAVETPKAAAKSAEPKEPKPAAPKAPAAAATGGAFWVQVCAYKDAETAKRVATRLRGQGLNVEESTTSVAGGPAAPAAASTAAVAKPVSDRYDVIVSGASASDVDAKLSAKGMTSEATSNGIVVRPSLALRDAVALSRDLADSGMNVQVRRVSVPAPSPEPLPAPAPVVAASTGGQTLHRVRVGSFPDRAAAVTAMKQLEDKGFKPFITPGGR